MPILTPINATGDRLQCLQALAETLAEAIDNCDGSKLLPALARQYREALREIDEIQTTEDEDIADIIGDLPKVR